MNIKAIAVAVGLAAFGGASQAQIVFSDDFNSATIGGSLTPSGWSVASGTVDVVGPGWFGNLCAAGGGNCVDLDGSSLQGGTLVKSLSLTGGLSYTATFDLAGNQRGYGPDSVAVSFGSSSLAFSVLSSAPWVNYSLTFAPTTSGTFFLSFANAGGDNVGAVLDNVSVTAVPEPGTYAMFLAGLGLMGVIARRRRG